MFILVDHRTRATARTLLGVVLIAALLSVVTPLAHAGSPPPVRPLSAAQARAAVAAAHTAHAISIAKSNFREGGKHSKPTRVAVAESGVAVFSLSADFVRESPGAAVANFGYYAVPVTAPDGRVATIQVQRDGGGHWSVATVMSGDDETRLAAHLPSGSVLFNEPQINGWYALSNTDVQLLEAALPQNNVGESIVLADYQKQVNSRYADKLPGSEYARNGGIGFAQTPPTQPGGRAANPARPEQGTPIAWWCAIAVAVLILGAVVLVHRRRDRSRPNH